MITSSEVFRDDVDKKFDKIVRCPFAQLPKPDGTLHNGP